MDGALWTSLLSIAGIWLVTVISPGPNFLATVQAAASESRRSGVVLATGIALGTTIWCTASLLGLGVLFQAAGSLYQAAKVIGAAYLIFLGIRAIATAGASGSQGKLGSFSGLSGAKAFRRGLLVDLSNPKAAAFFTSLFAVAVPPGAPLWFQALLGAVVVLIAWGWYALVACVIATDSMATAYRRMRKALDYLVGAIFIALGLRIAAER